MSSSAAWIGRFRAEYQTSPRCSGVPHCPHVLRVGLVCLGCDPVLKPVVFLPIRAEDLKSLLGLRREDLKRRQRLGHALFEPSSEPERQTKLEETRTFGRAQPQRDLVRKASSPATWRRAIDRLPVPTDHCLLPAAYCRKLLTMLAKSQSRPQRRGSSLSSSWPCWASWP